MTTEVVLKKTWALVQKHWQYLALVSLIVFVINILMAVVMGGSVAGGLAGIMSGSGDDSLGMGSLFTAAGMASLGLGVIVTILVTPLLTGASAHVGKLVFEGKTGSPLAPFQTALTQYVTFLLLTIVIGIALMIGFTLLIIPGVILAVLMGMAPTIAAFEGATVGTSLQKAWALGLKHFWTILLVGVVIAALSFVLSLVLALVPWLSAYASALTATVGAVAMAVIYAEAK